MEQLKSFQIPTMTLLIASWIIYQKLETTKSNCYKKIPNLAQDISLTQLQINETYPEFESMIIEAPHLKNLKPKSPYLNVLANLFQNIEFAKWMQNITRLMNMEGLGIDVEKGWFQGYLETNHTTCIFCDSKKNKLKRIHRYATDLTILSAIIKLKDY